MWLQGMLWACSIVSAIHDAATESDQVSVFPTLHMQTTIRCNSE